VDTPNEGNCATAAVHRTGDLVIAVSAGGVPSAAARVRDEIAAHFGDAYAAAISRLGAVRAELLAQGHRDRWVAIAADVIGPDFCETVERGALHERLMAWH
jgi:siroheme synthase (precorrin-2 oxidase/ferrochelatase)